MFTKSTAFYDAIYHFKNYEVACARLRQMLQELHPSAKSLLDVACGTGKHLEWLQHEYEVEGLDLNPEMLKIAASRCPNVPMHLGNMISFDIGARFDVITCLFSSIAYVETLENLGKAISCMASHLNEGGVLLLEPWFWPENYWTGTITANFVNEDDLKIAWMYNSVAEGRVASLNIHYLVGTPENVEHFTELHRLGLFADGEYRSAFLEAGMEVEHDKDGLFGRGMYIGKALQ